MAWAAIDDAILDNGKIGRAGALGLLLHTAAISWCARNLTDGRLPKHKVACLLNLSGVYVAPGNDAGVPMRTRSARKCRTRAPDVQAISAHLAALGLWHDRGEEWEIHDYLTYNPSRVQVLARRAASRARVQKHRAGGGGNAGCNAVGNAVTNDASPSPSPIEEKDPDPDARARATRVEGRTRARDPEPGRSAQRMRRGPARAAPLPPRGGPPTLLGDILAAAAAKRSQEISQA